MTDYVSAGTVGLGYEVSGSATGGTAGSPRSSAGTIGLALAVSGSVTVQHAYALPAPFEGRGGIRIGALRETITVFMVSDVRGAEDGDRYGDVVGTTSAGVSYPAQVEPFRITYEKQAAEDIRSQRYKCIVAPSTIVDGLSTVLWRGVMYEVDGEVQDEMYRNGIHHREFVLKLVEGL